MARYMIAPKPGMLRSKDGETAGYNGGTQTAKDGMQNRESPEKGSAIAFDVGSAIHLVWSVYTLHIN